ncbi:single-stranded DNA-binding protein [Persicitalea jodogahamensis]|uniref:Single-stranded DNA-binding protein n=1 Tax=Persicitalea jodogahamensis TaxID=402147 RepID=A0A8J3G873_9BACT|nr:single-stranded DNA-binding protein [Persicitalea jodogahamensis]GHB62626.1 hypothetical protein GCM10007390_15580 [Persicitalea jodogahamensis]
MRGLNRVGEPKVTLIGNLGSNPEVQKFQGDANVAKFSLATTESLKDSIQESRTARKAKTLYLSA